MRSTSANDGMSSNSDDCFIYAKPAGRGYFQWGWQSADGQRRSARAFLYFYDCMADAQRNGYAVDPARVAAQLRAQRLTIRVVAKVTESLPQP